MQDIQSKIQKMLDQAVEKGDELGIQAAAYYKGELIVDAFAGTADRAAGRKVDESTIFPVFSTTKGIAATVLHILAEQGKLDYDMRISEIWPEFGVNGKEKATVRNALNHTAGIPQMPEGIGLPEVVDWNGMCGRVAALTPQWTPGEHMEYHAITFSWIVGEIARRVDGRFFSDIMRDEICKPLGITDLFVGIPDEAEPLVAILEEPEFDRSALNATGPQSIPAWIQPLHEWMNRPDARRACVPASNGIMSAKAAARHYASLLPGGVDGVELLPPARIKTATEPLILPDGTFVAVGLGYFLGSGDGSIGPSVSVFGHGGYGGSLAYGDPENSLAVGLTKNLFSKNDVGAAVIKELKQGLGILKG